MSALPDHPHWTLPVLRRIVVGTIPFHRERPVLEALLEIIGELLLQALAEMLAEIGLQAMGEDSQRRPHPFLAAIGYACFGAILGFGSLTVLPNNLVPEPFRSSGFRGVITASNWTTADARVLGPLEKLSYLEGDFIDRHGYFAGAVKGENSEWSLRVGHTYADRSALRLEGDKPGAPKSFNHPVMDPEYNGRASMISETTWNRPNRHRGEAPLFYASYGALQDTDAIVHFALDGADWSVKPNHFMQPWTLMAPTQLGQFPATALLYRRGLVRTGDVLADRPVHHRRTRSRLSVGHPRSPRPGRPGHQRQSRRPWTGGPPRLPDPLQVMTGEQPTDWATETLSDGQKRITSPGRDPWNVSGPMPARCGSPRST